MKIINYVHRATTTRRAMPHIWFDTMVGVNLAVPMSMWTGNHMMLILAASLEVLLVAWYILGWVPVRKPARRAVTVAPRTRKTTRKTSINTRAAV